MADKYDFASVVDDAFKECISVEQMCARYVQLKNYLDSLFRQNVALMSMKEGE